MTDKPRRRAMTAARKRRIHENQRQRDGTPEGEPTRCGNGCGASVPLEGPGVVYEHVITFHNAPHLDDDGPNVQPWCPGCAKAKNERGRDPTTIAKTKRQAAMKVDKPPTGERKEKGPSRGFGKGRGLPGKGQGQRLKGASFPKGSSRPMRSRNDLRGRRG